MPKKKLVLIIHNIRSAHNVGSMLRSADGFGVDYVYLSGYSPYPKAKDDNRLPHISSRVDKQIHKTALGAERSIKWRYVENVQSLVDELKKQGFTIAALEQRPDAISLPDYQAKNSTALLVGSEVGGLDKELAKLADVVVDIPMAGKKDSFNVAVAAAVAMYKLRHH